MERMEGYYAMDCTAHFPGSILHFLHQTSLVHNFDRLLHLDIHHGLRHEVHHAYAGGAEKAPNYPLTIDLTIEANNHSVHSRK